MDIGGVASAPAPKLKENWLFGGGEAGAASWWLLTGAVLFRFGVENGEGEVLVMVTIAGCRWSVGM